jgi:hypothetical protein
VEWAAWAAWITNLTQNKFQKTRPVIPGRVFLCLSSTVISNSYNAEAAHTNGKRGSIYPALLAQMNVL